MFQFDRVVHRILSALASVAMLLGLTATAVALAPASSATGGVSRLQVSQLNTNIDVTNPDPATTYRNYTDARNSTVPMTVTFTGTASFTVDGGTPTALVSGTAANVPIHTGITAIAITQNDGSTDTVYNVEIKRAWLISGYEVYDGATDTLLLSRHVSDGNFDPLSRSAVRLSIPHSVATLKWKMFYDTPTEPTASSRSAWVGGAVACSGYECQSGELSEAHPVPTGSATYPVITQVDNGSGFDGYTWTQWDVSITRAPAYGSSALTSVTVPGSTFTEVTRLPYTFRTLIDADKSSVPLTANFSSGTASYSVNGGSSSAMTSGVASSIPLESGVNTVSITHTAPGGAQTVYTYRLIRPHPITGFEVADAATGDILFTKTGADFDVTNHQYYLNIANSISQVKIRSFYEPFPAGYASYSWIHSYGNCPEQCESGEWSNALNIQVGVNNGGPLMMCAIATLCEYGDWSYWMIQITRASVTADISSVSINGTAQARQVLTTSTSGVTGYPTPTVTYQWQTASSAGGPWSDIASATTSRLVLDRSFTGQFLRVQATSANGVSTPTTVYSSPTAAVANVAPSAPTRVTAVPGDHTLTVSWAPPIDADYAGATVTATGGGTSRTCFSANFSCTVNGLTNGVDYTVTVVATVGSGAGEIDSPDSTAITASPAVPTAPDIAGASVSGNLNVGERLTATATDATGTPGPTLAYLWQTSADGTGGWSAIPGATHSKLVLTSAQVGSYVRVRITATTGVLPAAVAFSDPVGPVVATDVAKPSDLLEISLPGYNPSVRDVAFDSQGYMYVITGWSSGRDSVMKFAPGASGDDAPLAIWDRGDDGTTLWGAGIWVDSHDNVWVGDHNNRVWMLPAGSRPSDPPQLKLDSTSIDRAWDVAVDDQGYLYVGEYYRGQVSVFAPGVSVGARPVRTITTNGAPKGMTFDTDGSLIVATREKLQFFLPGGAGVSNTEQRTIASTPDCGFMGVTLDGDGRIWATGDSCTKNRIYNPNAVGEILPIQTFDGYFYGMGTNPITGNPSAGLSYQPLVATWDRSLLNLGALPTAGVPSVARVAVAVSGDATVRGGLTATSSGLTGMPAPTMTGVWEQAGSASGPWTAIAGATGTSLELSSDLEGAFIRFTVTVTNLHGTSSTSSVPVGPVGPRPARGYVRSIQGSNMGVDTITDLEYLPGDRIAASNQWASLNRISVFGPSASGNVAPVQQIEMDFGGGYKSGWGLSLAPDGGLWAAYHAGIVAKVLNTDDGLVTPQRTMRTNITYARAVIEDANGYVYVGRHDVGIIKVFAPGATETDEPIRTISVPHRGLALDAHGNLLVGGNSRLYVYEPGASTNNEPIKEVTIPGTGWDIGIDGAHRVWVLTTWGQLVVFNPEFENTSTPVLTIGNDWAIQMSGANSLAVSKESPGVFALSNGTWIKTYDWSSLLPAVPGDSAPTIASATLVGDIRVGGDVYLSLGAITGYPDARLSYQWQRASSASGPWSDISGAVGDHYFPGSADAAKYLRSRVTVTNSIGSSSTLTDSSSQLGYGYVRSPLETLRGSRTGINGAWIVRPTANGGRIVANYQGAVLEYAPGATQDATPIRRITVEGHSAPSGLTVVSDGSRWISYEGNSFVAHVAADASGTVTPLQSFNPQCGRPGSVAIDAQGLIYVPCSYDGVIKVFAADATGTPNPVRTITGQSTVREVTFDPAGNLAVPGANFYRTFALGGDGTSNNPIVDKSLNFAARSVAWDTHGNIIFSEAGGIHAYTADLADTNTQVAGFTSDGWSATADIYGIWYDGANDRLDVASYYYGVTTHDWPAILEGDPDTPSPATNLRATVGIHTFTLTWDATPGEVTNYVVTATGGAQPLVCTTTETSCTFDWADGVRGETNYSVNVQTIRRSASATSDSITVTPEVDPNSRPPAKIGGVSATGLNGVISVSWTAPRGTVTSYTVTAVSGATTLTCEPDPSTDTSCDVTGATTGETYSVRVVAHRFDLDSTPSDAVSVVVERREAPTIEPLVLTGNPRSSETLTVDEPIVAGFPEPTVTYQWQSAASDSGPWTSILDATELTKDLKKPDVGRYLRLVVVADNGVGDPVRRYTRVVGPVVSMAGTTEVQGLPITGLRGAFGDGKVTLTWDRVRGITADTYTVTVLGGSGSPRTYSVAGNTLTKVVMGLVNGTSYRFQVVATGHDETVSKRIEVMPVGLLGKVTRVSATLRGTTISVQWSRPAGTSPVAGYRVVLDSLTKGAPDREAVVKGNRVVFEKLAKGATYKVSITGRNVVGTGATFVVAAPVQVK